MGIANPDKIVKYKTKPIGYLNIFIKMRLRAVLGQYELLTCSQTEKRGTS